MVINLPATPNSADEYRTLLVRNSSLIDGYTMLIDSGASIPMWADSLTKFNNIFPDAKPHSHNTLVKGVTGVTESTTYRRC